MISPTTADLESEVRGYIADGSEMDSKYVIPGNDNGPAPEQQYATCLLITSGRDSMNWSRAYESNAQTVVAVYTSLTLKYSVQWYRKGSRDAAEAFRAWASSPLGQNSAERRGLTFYRTSDLRQLDAMISDQWEERVGLDLMIGTIAINLPKVVGRIGSAQIVIDPDEAAVPPRTITVGP